MKLLFLLSFFLTLNSSSLSQDPSPQQLKVIDQLLQIDPDLANDISIMLEEAQIFYLQKISNSNLTQEQKIDKAKTDAMLGILAYHRIFTLYSYYLKKNGGGNYEHFMDSTAKANNVERLVFIDKYLEKRLQKFNKKHKKP